VYAWVHLEEISVPSLCIYWWWHLPDGSVYDTYHSSEESCADSPYRLGERSEKYWSRLEISGRKGLHWVDVWAEIGGWSEYITTMYFGVDPSAGTAQTQ
jgi:hypothetical protein